MIPFPMPSGAVLKVAAVALLVAAAWAYTSHLKGAVADAEQRANTAERTLNDTITRHATAVTAAVQRARTEERKALTAQQEKYDELKTANARNVADLDAARQRLRNAASRPGAAGAANLPGTAPTTTGIAAASGDELRPEDRELIDGLLQVAQQANAAARERNFLAEQYQVNCQKVAADVQ